MTRRLALAFLVAPLIHAQAPPAFDVASVKSDPWGGNGSVGIRVIGDTLTAEHTCLYSLILFAYNVRNEHLSGGPSWARCGVLEGSDLYQVIAKTGGAPPPPMDQFRLMLQNLLADRFQLKVHHTPKDLPIYNLVAAPRGPKLKQSSADAKFSMSQDARLNGGRAIRITATSVSMERMLPIFEHFAERPLFDRTGLTGSYDLDLTFDTDLASATGPDAVGQGFATALEKQLGLNLESSTAPFDTIVIDRAEKPSGN